MEKTREGRFENIRCKPGSVGYRTDDQKTQATYNIHACQFCGRKWHIYETPPICQEYREKYPNEIAFIDQEVKLAEEVERERIRIGIEDIDAYDPLGYIIRKNEVLSVISNPELK